MKARIRAEAIVLDGRHHAAHKLSATGGHSLNPLVPRTAANYRAVLWFDVNGRDRDQRLCGRFRTKSPSGIACLFELAGSAVAAEGGGNGNCSFLTIGRRAGGPCREMSAEALPIFAI